MRRTPREFQAVGQVAERNRTFGHELDDIQAAKQRLTPEPRRLQDILVLALAALRRLIGVLPIMWYPY